MASRLTKLLLLGAFTLGPWTMGGIVSSGNRVWAQPPTNGGEGGEARPRWRRFGDGERGRGNREGGDSSRNDRRSSSGSTSGETAPTAAANTTSTSTSSPPAASSNSSSSSTKPTGSSSSSSGSMALTEYAKSLVKQHDKNGDMMLQPDERKELKGRAAEADLDKDGVITIDELVKHLSPSSSTTTAGSTSSASSGSTGNSGSSSSTSSSGFSANRSGNDAAKQNSDASKRVFYGSAGGSAANTEEGDKRHSYRFTPANERLPSGLPSWFTSKDSNRDGQVQMSEYSRFWTKSTLAEFRRYDLNDDGMITPKEVAKRR